MRSLRNIMAAMLVCMTFAAFQSDADAQTRRSSGSRSENKSTVSRGNNSATTKPSSARSSGSNRPKVSKPSSSAARPGNTATRPSSQSRPSVSRPSVSIPSQNKPAVTRPSGQTKPSVSKPAGSKPSAPSVKPGEQNRPAQITRPGRPVSKPSDRPSQHNPSVRPDRRPDAKPQTGHGHGPQKPPVHIRPDHHVPRIHPRDRDFMRWDRPAYYWSSHDHCYGHRVKILPSHVVRHIYHGITYYCCNDIWYRPYGSHYVVCRPPFGTVLAADLIADMAWTAVRIAYYSTAAQTYSQINRNNEYIAQQNAIIAQNNALIAQQNAQIAQGQQLAAASYTLANSLGLVQSYAAAGSDYFYQDGVFYVKDASGQYKTIAPPAGALVETLPEDYDLVTLSDGKEYYKVDDTIYQVTVSEGKPFFEVLGQQY